MGDKEERSGIRNFQYTDTDQSFFARVWETWLKWGRPNSLMPVHVYSSEKYHRPPVQTVSFWQLCKAWGRYHYMQMRWDIERGLARLLHRRWV